MSAAELIVSRLDRVRQVAPDRWRADCPTGHKSKWTLSIREHDGRALVHCFGGCDAPDILASIGLSLGDLYPTPLRNHDGQIKPSKPGHWHMAREALKTLHREVLIVAIAAENIAAGVALDAADRALVIDAASKIRATAEICA